MTTQQTILYQMFIANILVQFASFILTCADQTERNDALRPPLPKRKHILISFLQEFYDKVLHMRKTK